MLKEGLLKENIDGEALKWAFEKMTKRKEERKILMVISDGAPVDDSTLSTNSSDFLETNLKNTVKWIEDKTNVELLAIGIGHDVTRYYKKAVKITDVQDLGDVMINQLTDLFKDDKRVLNQYFKSLNFKSVKSLILLIKILKGTNIIKATINFTDKSPNANVNHGISVP